MPGQAGFWDIDERYALLSEAGDPLEKLNSVVPWDVFRKPLAKALKRSDVRPAQSNGSHLRHSHQTLQQPAGPKCFLATLSVPIPEDRCSVHGPSNHPPLMERLNQTSNNMSHHNRFIEKRTCS